MQKHVNLVSLPPSSAKFRAAKVFMPRQGCYQPPKYLPPCAKLWSRDANWKEVAALGKVYILGRSNEAVWRYFEMWSLTLVGRSPSCCVLLSRFLFVERFFLSIFFFCYQFSLMLSVTVRRKVRLAQKSLQNGNFLPTLSRPLPHLTTSLSID